MLNSHLLSNVKLIAFKLDNTSLLTHMQLNSREQLGAKNKDKVLIPVVLLSPERDRGIWHNKVRDLSG